VRNDVILMRFSASRNRGTSVDLSLLVASDRRYNAEDGKSKGRGTRGKRWRRTNGGIVYARRRDIVMPVKNVAVGLVVQTAHKPKVRGGRSPRGGRETEESEEGPEK